MEVELLLRSGSDYDTLLITLKNGVEDVTKCFRFLKYHNFTKIADGEYFLKFKAHISQQLYQ